MLKYYDQLKPRNNGELTGRKPGSYEWFHIQDNVAYFQDFEKPKIVWGNLALRSQFSFVKENYYINAPSAFIATENYYLLAVLNSKIADYYIKQLGVTRNGGYFEYKPMFIQQLPIPNVAEKEQKQFQLIIEKLLYERAENRNTADLEIRIDEMIYELYDLSNEEAAFLNSI